MPRTISSHEVKPRRMKCPSCGREIALSKWGHYYRHNVSKGKVCYMSGRRWRPEYAESLFDSEGQPPPE